MSLCMEGSETLGNAIFGHAELGDRRRTTRLVKTFDQLCRHPGGTLPDKLAAPRDLKALYRLTLLDLRDASRRADAKTRSAVSIISRDYVAVLTAWR